MRAGDEGSATGSYNTLATPATAEQIAEAHTRQKRRTWNSQAHEDFQARNATQSEENSMEALGAQ